MREEGEGRRGQTIVTPTSWAQGDKNATDGQILELSEIYSLHNTSAASQPGLETPETGKQTLI